MTGTAAALDPNDAAFIRDPYPDYAALRRQPGLSTSAHLGWLVARHADVSALLHDRRLGSAALNAALYVHLPPEAQASIAPFQASMAHSMLFQDPPDHSRLRRLVSQAFTPRRVESLRARIEQITEDLLADLGDGETFDIISRLAFPLPARVIATLLGVPWSDLDGLKRWTDAGTAFLGSARTTTDPVGLAAHTGVSYRALTAYFAALAEQHRADPGDDLICAMLVIEAHGDGLTPEELISTCGLLFTAGHETTTNLIGNGLLALLQHPDQLQRLRDEPALLPAAVEELLRYDSPVQFIYRVSLAEVEVGADTIPPGSLVTLLLGAANRDGTVYPDPDRIDVGRHPRQYLSFGTGAHACLGAFLARLETEIALSVLLRRFPSMGLADEQLEWCPNPIFRGVERLPVTV
jgi:cytochrome P450